ncbi:MAG: hypothetical protein U0793_19540 [Gemmataceae bacterium]
MFTAAKRHQERRFHALYDRIWRIDVLLEAWQVRSNKGAAGIDSETLTMIEQQGVRARFLLDLQDVLRAGSIGRNQLRQRLFQADKAAAAAGHPDGAGSRHADGGKIVLEPIFEADFEPCSYGFRPRCGRDTQAARGHPFDGWAATIVVDADIQGFFDAINQDILLEQ